MATAPKLRATTPGAQGNLFGAPVDNTDYLAMDAMERARQARANPLVPGAGQPVQQMGLPFDSAPQAKKPAAGRQPKLRATTPGAQGNLFGAPIDNTDYRAMDAMERARQARANPMMSGAGQSTQMDLPFNEAQRPAVIGGRAVAPNGMGYAPPQPQIGTPRFMGTAERVYPVPSTVGVRAVAPNGMGYTPWQAPPSGPDTRFMGDVERVHPTQPALGGAARAAAVGARSALARGAARAAGALTGPVGAAIGTIVPAMVDMADSPMLAGLSGVDDPSGGFVDYSAGTAAPAAPAGYRGQDFSDPRIVTPAPQADPNATYQGMTPANAGPVAPRPVARPAARPAARPVTAAPQQLFAPGVGDDSRARAMQYLRDQGLLP